MQFFLGSLFGSLAAMGSVNLISGHMLNGMVALMLSLLALGFEIQLGLPREPTKGD